MRNTIQLPQSEQHRCSRKSASPHRFYLGLSSELIDHCYSPTAPFASSEIAFASLAFTAFPLPTSPAPAVYVPSTSTSTYRILMSVASRPPQTTSTIGQHLSYSRLLLGDQLADHLLLPHGSTRERVHVWTEVLAGRALVAFGRRWRTGWEAERIKLMREVIELLVVWGLGERRTKFVVREEKSWGEKLTAGESDEPVSFDATVAMRAAQLLTTIVFRGSRWERKSGWTSSGDGRSYWLRPSRSRPSVSDLRGSASRCCSASLSN